MGKSDLTSSEMPEARELARKRAELSSLEEKLADSELELATIQGELRDFEARYIQVIGSRYAELDAIEAEIAERIAIAHPADADMAGEAARARSRADDTAESVAGSAETPYNGKDFKPSERLKTLYRKAAKAMHPDLGTDPKDVERRQRQMAEVNLAYESGDDAKLEEILRQWESSPESIRGDGPGVDLVRTIRKIAQVEERLSDISAQIAQLNRSESFHMRVKVATAQEQGRDLFAEMAADLDIRIAEAHTRLQQCTTQEGQSR